MESTIFLCVYVVLLRPHWNPIKFATTNSKYHGSAQTEVFDCTKCAHFPDIIGAACGDRDLQFD